MHGDGARCVKLGEDEMAVKILEAIGGKKRQPKTIADTLRKEKQIVKTRLEGLRREGLVEKTKSGWWLLTDSGAEVIGVEKREEKVNVEDLIGEVRESMLKAFRDSVEEIKSEIRKLTITGEKTSEVRVPGISEFEDAIVAEHARLYVDAIDAVRIPELRRSIKVKLGIDRDIFDELVIQLFESGRYKIEEGSGDDGLRYRGRNFMFLKKR